MSEVANGIIYRSLINDEEIKYEKSVSFEPDEVKITILGDYKTFVFWSQMRGAKVNFKIANTDVDQTRMVKDVRMVWSSDHAVEILVILWEEKRFAEYKEFWKR